jgi:hypothetical protein
MSLLLTRGLGIDETEGGGGGGTLVITFLGLPLKVVVAKGSVVGVTGPRPTIIGQVKSLHEIPVAAQVQVKQFIQAQIREKNLKGKV